AAGDFYQVNLARRLEARFLSAGDAASLTATAGGLHRAPRGAAPAAFSALMPLAEAAWLVSGSPECLLEWDGSTRVAKSFPIKGTLARGASRAADTPLPRRP